MLGLWGKKPHPLGVFPCPVKEALTMPLPGEGEPVLELELALAFHSLTAALVV